MKFVGFFSYIILQIVLKPSDLFFAKAETIKSNLQRCLADGEFSPDVDYFPDKFVPHETTDLFSITYHSTYKIIHNKYQNHNKTYLLYQCGTEPPEEELDGRHQAVLPVPHTGGFGVTETPQITPLEILGKRSEIKGYWGDPKYVSSPCLDIIIADNTDMVIFDPQNPWGASSVTLAMEEKWMNDHPDALIFRGIFNQGNGDRDLTVAETQEKTTVATFDWLGFYAAFFNLEKKANQIVSETEERYSCSAQNAAYLSSDMPEEEKPSILWAQYFNGTLNNGGSGWSVAECPLDNSVYYCEYAYHCGANILSRPEGFGFSESYGGPEVYWYLNDEQFLEFGKDADTWIYPAAKWEMLYDEKKDLFDQFKSVQKRQVYDVQGKGGSFAWSEQRFSEYDVVALDFCEVVGLSNPNPPLHVRTWLRNIFSETVSNPMTCNAGDIDEPYVPEGASCNLVPEISARQTSSSGNLSLLLVQITSTISAAVACVLLL